MHMHPHPLNTASTSVASTNHEDQTTAAATGSTENIKKGTKTKNAKYETFPFKTCHDILMVNWSNYLLTSVTKKSSHLHVRTGLRKQKNWWLQNFHFFFCKRLTQIFVLVRTGQYTYCEIDRKLLHITFLIPVQLRNTTLLVLFTFNYEDNNLRLRSVDGTQQISG